MRAAPPPPDIPPEEAQGIIAQNLERFIASDAGRAGQINDGEARWHVIRELPNFRDLMKLVLKQWLDAQTGQSVNVHQVMRAVTYFTDSTGGYETFQDPSFSALRIRLAQFFVQVIQSVIEERGMDAQTVLRFQDLNSVVLYLVGMRNYSTTTSVFRVGSSAFLDDPVLLTWLEMISRGELPPPEKNPRTS